MRDVVHEWFVLFHPLGHFLALCIKAKQTDQLMK